MATRTISFLLVGVALLALPACNKNAKDNLDASGQIPEKPTVVTVKGETDARFAARESPTLTKWWNGRIQVECPPGYHFNTRPAPQYDDQRGETATCEVNRLPAPAKKP